MQSSTSKTSYTAIQQSKVYFTRKSNGVNDASYVNLLESDTLLAHVKKLKTIQDPQFMQILKKPEEGNELVFIAQQIDSVPLVIPFSRADNDKSKLSIFINLLTTSI